jgi:hypothetical protein
VRARQVERMTGVSYKTALFLLHRVRWAMVDTHGEPLFGTVQVDAGGHAGGCHEGVHCSFDHDPHG